MFSVSLLRKHKHVSVSVIVNTEVSTAVPPTVWDVDLKEKVFQIETLNVY